MAIACARLVQEFAMLTMTFVLLDLLMDSAIVELVPYLVVACA